MVFSSITFLLVFLPLFLMIYYLTPHKFRNITLLAFSIFFYSWGAPKFIFILLGSTFLDFYLVRWMHNTPRSSKKRFLLAFSIFINLGLLAFFKYANFFVENMNSILAQFGAENVQWTAIVLPIGISFYTFQTLTYSIDVYRGVHKPLDHAWDYVLYIIMFPQLIAGPIVRYNHVADQIVYRRETSDDRLLGFYRFCIGLGKKVLIANTMGQTADLILNGELNELSMGMAWIGIIAYTFQIYFDFSGYSDMAIGLGRMIGFKFPENFNNPYISRSITEFWRRWHMTLGSWMRDYLYIPMGGSRVDTKRRLFFNLWFVFLVSGLWHGASWNFVIWGAYHGLFLIFDRLFLDSLLKKAGKFVSTAVTFFLVIMGWVIFRIEDFDQAAIFYSRLFSFDFEPIMWRTLLPFLITLVFALYFSFQTAFSRGKELCDKVFGEVYSSRMKYVFLIVSVVFLALSIASITSSGFNPFIYFRF